jgi:Flp pilus assembly protein TadG
MAPNRRNPKGQVLVLLALMLVVLLGIAALAVDFGRAYGVRAKLNAAVDVAAISAGRAVSGGRSAITTQATNVFNANYPAGLLGATVTDPVTNALQNTDGSWTITVSATASLPTGFAGVLGWQNIPVSASATSHVRTLDMVLVLDSSGSLAPPFSPATTMDLLRGAAQNFIQKFNVTSDRVGLIHFASGAVTDQTITTTKGFNLSAIQGSIGRIVIPPSPSPVGNTASEEAMRLAKAQLDAIPASSQNNLRVIVLFTDGAPNVIAGNFGGSFMPGDLFSEIGALSDSNKATNMYDTNLQISNPRSFSGNTLPDTDYTGTVNLRSDLVPPSRPLATAGGSISNSECNVNRAARNMLENVANAARSESGTPIQIFTIGLGARLLNNEVTTCGYNLNKEIGQNILLRLANVPSADTYNAAQPTGLYVSADSASQLNDAFQKVANQILRLSR